MQLVEQGKLRLDEPIADVLPELRSPQVLEEAGYSVWFQDWDFTGNFFLEMDRAHTQNLWRRAADGLTPGRCETDQGAAE